MDKKYVTMKSNADYWSICCWAGGAYSSIMLGHRGNKGAPTPTLITSMC